MVQEQGAVQHFSAHPPPCPARMARHDLDRIARGLGQVPISDVAGGALQKHSLFAGQDLRNSMSLSGRPSTIAPGALPKALA